MTTPLSARRNQLTNRHVVVPESIEADVLSQEDGPTVYRNERLLTPEDVASVLQIGRTRVYELLTYGKLRSVRIGKSRRIRRSDLDEFISSLVTESNGH